MLKKYVLDECKYNNIKELQVHVFMKKATN